jgi:hypothetical protein
MKGKLYRRKMDTRGEMLDHVMNITARKNDRQDALRQATRRVLTWVAKCINVDGGIFENTLGKLYQLYHSNNKYIIRNST